MGIKAEYFLGAITVKWDTTISRVIPFVLGFLGSKSLCMHSLP